MALVLPNSVYLHVPKCGGMWIREAIKRAGIPSMEVGDQHSHFPELLRYRDDTYFRKRLVFTFIRHPVTWYQSRWAFRLKSGWRLTHPLDYNCASNDFNAFVRNCFRYKPTGWLNWKYGTYIVPEYATFVGKMENLAEDLIRILRMAGEKFVEADIRNTPRINDSDLDGKSSRDVAIYEPEVLELVQTIERPIIQQYYPEFSPSVLCRLRSL